VAPEPLPEAEPPLADEPDEQDPPAEHSPSPSELPSPCCSRAVKPSIAAVNPPTRMPVCNRVPLPLPKPTRPLTSATAAFPAEASGAKGPKSLWIGPPVDTWNVVVGKFSVSITEWNRESSATTANSIRDSRPSNSIRRRRLWSAFILLRSLRSIFFESHVYQRMRSPLLECSSWVGLFSPVRRNRVQRAPLAPGSIMPTKSDAVRRRSPWTLSSNAARATPQNEPRLDPVADRAATPLPQSTRLPAATSCPKRRPSEGGFPSQGKVLRLNCLTGYKSTT